jgi:superoxide dismutase, Fe-Mn family
MTLHHGKHYTSYVTRYNAAANTSTSAVINATTPLPVALSLVGVPEALPSDADLATTIRNQGGGAWNHALFWRTIAPQGSAPTRYYTSSASPQLKAAVDEAFGGLAPLFDSLAKASAGVFGSGWAFLCANVSPYGKRAGVGAPLAPPRLSVVTAPNQDSPLIGLAAAERASAERCVPIFGLDVWEHAYYLKYKNVRADYVAAVLGNGTTGLGGAINWVAVSKNLAKVAAAAEKGGDAALLSAAGAIGQA